MEVGSAIKVVGIDDNKRAVDNITTRKYRMRSALGFRATTQRLQLIFDFSWVFVSVGQGLKDKILANTGALQSQLFS